MESSPSPVRASNTLFLPQERRGARLWNDAAVGWYENHVVPRLVDLLCVNRRMEPLREQAVAGVEGDVLELGFGSGGNLPVYPAAVERVIAIDPSEVGRRLARKRIEASPIEVEFAGLRGEDLPLDDASVDHAVSTWTLCTIPDAVRAIGEVRRVLRPNGRLHFIEHGLSPDPKVAKTQHRFDRFEQRIAGGCHLDRDIRSIIEAGGLEIERCDNFSIAGPKAWSYLCSGTARRP
jgi:SAM-dependent methyltransferase